MSILSKLEQLNQTDTSTKDRISAITEYFSQDKIKDLFVEASKSEKDFVIFESNEDFQIWFRKDSIEIFRARFDLIRTREIKVFNALLSPESSYVKSWPVDPTVLVTFSDQILNVEITTQPFETEDFIKNVDYLLFEKGKTNLMSIESKLEQKEEMIVKRENRQSKVQDYLNSDKVKDLFSRYLSSASDKSTLIEDNGKFRLYLTRDYLELYKYEKIEVSKSVTPIPILRSIFRRVETVNDLSYEPVFRLQFDESGFHEIIRFVLSLTADELIEALDDLLFEKGTN